jgi:hypothetical protein
MTNHLVQAFPLSCQDSQDSITPLNSVSVVDNLQALYRLLIIRTGQRTEAERALNEILNLSLNNPGRTAASRAGFVKLFRKALEVPVTPGGSPGMELSGWPLALHQLAEPGRSALTLFYLEIFSPRELAEILGIDIGKLARVIGAARLALENQQMQSDTPGTGH